MKFKVLLPLTFFLAVQTVLFAGCDTIKRDVAITGSAVIGSAKTKGASLPLPGNAGDRIEVTVRLLGAGVWEKPRSMSCSLSAGYFDHTLSTQARLDPVSSQYTLPLTINGRLVATDKMCGKMTAVRIQSFERIELTAKVRTSTARCQAFCSLSILADCSARCERATYLQAAPTIAVSGVLKLVDQASRAGRWQMTLGTGLEFAFDTLAD